MDISPYSISYSPYVLKFKEPAGTSRGVYTEKLTYFLRLQSKEEPDKVGYGEIPVFQGLSKESAVQVEDTLRYLISNDIACLHPGDYDVSSIYMGFETALGDIQNGAQGVIFPSDFIKGQEPITINGLVWMGDFRSMCIKAKEKIDQGFSCIKVKIGAINWDEELRLLEYIRTEGGNDITIRVDANGAFSPTECLTKLNQLSLFDIHSIEQPIKAGQPEEMKRICLESPIPVALDEELIGIPPGNARWELLATLRPQFIVLKPALCYGFNGAYEWIRIAEELGIDWWITSSLESNIGLNAIAQFTARFHRLLPQGLGTGNLFTNNFLSPLKLEGENLVFKGPSDIYRNQLEKLHWVGKHS